MRTIATRYANNTSLMGVPFINRARRWYSKLFWSLVFLAAMAAMLQQTYKIFEKYYSRKTTTSVSIGYDNLAFPSFTLCNINPIRRSKVYEAGGPIAEFVDEISPRDDYGYQWDDDYFSGSGSGFGDASGDDEPDPQADDPDPQADGHATMMNVYDATGSVSSVPKSITDVSGIPSRQKVFT